MIFTSVDFPAPFSPTRAWTSPASRSSETPSSACTPPNDFERVVSLRSGGKGVRPRRRKECWQQDNSDGTRNQKQNPNIHRTRIFDDLECCYSSQLLD